jgi:hypothetical protein
MGRIGLLALVLAFFLGGVLGCGGGKPNVGKENRIKARQDSQKDKKQGKFMQPDEEDKGPDF